MNRQATDPGAPPPAPARHWPDALRSLRYRNFRLFFIGQSISLIGTWMQQVAMGWLVYRLTQSTQLLSVIAFCTQIPTLVIAPMAGVVAEHFNRHRIMLLTQSLAMVQALTLAALVLTGQITANHVTLYLIPLSLFMGLINSIDMPARQSFFVHMIEDRADLGNAIALNSSMVNASRLVGPLVAGLMIAHLSEGMCFLINGLSYLAVIWGLLAMHLKGETRAPGEMNLLREMKEGFGYAVGFAPVRMILLLLALGSLVGVPYTVLMPAVARDLLHGDSRTYGWLLGSAGLGAFAGAFALASRRTVLGLGRRLALSAALFGLGLIGFSFSRSLWLSMGLLLMTGFGMITILAGANTILQTLVSDAMRGRIMSVYSMCFMGVMPFGSLLAGVMAHHFGVPWTICGGGILMILVGLFFASQLPRLRVLTRPIYIEKGILPRESPAEAVK